MRGDEFPLSPRPWNIHRTSLLSVWIQVLGKIQDGELFQCRANERVWAPRDYNPGSSLVVKRLKVLLIDNGGRRFAHEGPSTPETNWHSSRTEQTRIAIEMYGNSSTQFGTNSNSSPVWIPHKSNSHTEHNQEWWHCAPWLFHDLQVFHGQSRNSRWLVRVYMATHPGNPGVLRLSRFSKMCIHTNPVNPYERFLFNFWGLASSLTSCLSSSQGR